MQVRIMGHVPPRSWCAMSSRDRIGEWFLSKQAERLGLAFTIFFGLGCVPDIVSTFAPRCSIFHKLVIAPRLLGAYRAQVGCEVGK